MRISVDILDASDNPIATLQGVTSVSVARVLDGPGRISFSVPCAAAGADAITVKRRARFTLDYLGVRRDLGTMIIDKVADRDNNGTWERSADGSDILTELKHVSTLVGRSFANQSAAIIVNSLINLASGWGMSADAAAGLWSTSIRYDGDTVLRALQILAETGGFHLRLGDSGKALEFGAFGDETDILICNAGQFPPDGHNAGDTGFITSISMERTSEPLATRIYPLGAGNSGDAALTIASSSRTAPYTIQNTTANSRTHYYIENPAAVAEYGVVEKYGQFKNIAPLANTVADIQAAANALYDVAAIWLRRNSVVQETLRVSVAGLNRAVKPGDKVRLTYKGRLQTDTADWLARDYDDYFWVVSVTERVSSSGITLELMLSNVDKQDENEAETIVGSIEELRVQGIRVQPTFAPLPFTFQDSLDATHDLTVAVPIIDSAVFQLQRALLYLRTTPFRVNAKAETSSTAHDHLVLRSSDGTAAGTMATRRFTIVEQTTGTLYHFDASADVGASARFFSTAPGGGHTHTLDYGVYDDTDYPDHISVSINSSSVVTGLDSGGTGLNTVLTVTDYLQPPTAAALRQTHTIDITCTGGQGTIYGLLLLWCQFLPFALT